MRVTKAGFWIFAVVAAFVSLCAVPAQAQSYPDRPVHIIVGAAPGGGTDFVARALARHLSKAWGQPVIVESRLGAAGATANEYVAKSTPDGYTLLVVSDDITALSAYRSDLPYNLLTDFTPVSVIDEIPLVLVTSPSLPVHDLKGLIALAKSEPGKVTYGSAGVGSMAHLLTAQMAAMAHVSMTHVPYKGTAAAVVGVAGGEIDTTFVNIAAAQGMVTSGKLRVLAVSSPQRWPSAPSVPTISEAGIPGYSFVTWGGMFGPAGLPKDIVAKLSAAIAQAAASPDMIAAVATQSGVPASDSPEQFAQLVRDDLEDKTKIAEMAGLKAK